MAHANYEDLADLEPILDLVRTWAGIQERKPGTFYLRGRAFLHFHTKGERRWADARTGAEWGPELDIAPSATAKERKVFLKALEAAYAATLG
tara:strand:- start:282 stop:557 length:276 start_codon:yes stop_codon:yes gene_type:complete